MNQILSDEKLADIVERYRNGASARELIETTHHRYRTIRRALASVGVRRVIKASQRRWVEYISTRMYRPDELAWVAGFVDGEGCMYLGCGPVLAVRNTYRASIQRLADLFSGRVRQPGLAPLSKRVIYEWAISGDASVIVLKLIRPWLIVKADQADLLIDFDNRRSEISRDEYAAIVQRIKDLKRV